MSQVPLQSSPFEPIRLYDAPETLFSMVLDGEATFAGTRALFFEPARLTPLERDGIAARMKRVSGNNSITNAMIDIATNPFVWFYFATTPVGGAALGRGAGSLFQSVGKRYSALIRENAPLFAWGHTAQQVAERTTLAAADAQIAAKRMQMNVEFSQAIEKPLHAVLERYKLPHLDWTKINDPAKKALARRISTVLHGAREGWDRNVVEAIVTVDEGLVNIVNVQRPALLRAGVVAREATALGLNDLLKSVDDVLLRRADELFGDDEQLRRIFGLVRNRVFTGGKEIADDTTVVGAEIIRNLLGPASEKVALGEMPFDQFKNAVELLVRQPVKQNRANFMPRNLVDDVLGGRVLPADAYAPTRNNPVSGLRASNSVYNREVQDLLIHPDDLRHIATVFPGQTTAALVKRLHSSEKIFAESMDAPRRFLRHNFMESIARYHDSTARTISLVQIPNAEVLAVNAQLRNELKPRVVNPDAVGGRGFSAAGKDINDKLKLNVEDAMDVQIARGAVPPGGFSVADAIEADWKVMPNSWAQRVVSDIMVPSAMGIATPKSLFAMEVLNRSKATATNFANSGFGKMISDTGPAGQRFIDSLRNWGERATELGDARGFTRTVAGTLYVSHLGLNVGSVMLNLTQPFLLGPVLFGAANVARAYGAAIKEVFDYSTERFNRYGVRPISVSQRDELIRKHFKYANVDGEDLIGIRVSAFELLDDLATRGMRGTTIGREPRFGQYIFDYPMKLFEKTEWLNRNVMAHTVENFYRSNKLDLASPFFREDVRRTVRETQFGSGTMNTALGFQATGRGADLITSGELFANPVMRQFLSFQLRSFTAPFLTTSKLADTARSFPIIGERELGRLGAAAHDILRGIGFSAIGYEISKNVLGLDLSRSLFLSSQTDVLPLTEGGRFDARDGIFPVPPAIDMAYNFALGFGTGDGGLIKRNIARLLPGGVATQRFVGALPQGADLPFVPDPVDLQQTYADWNNRQTGPEGETLVPIYKSDGSLLEYRSATATILRSVGADMGGRPAAELERTLLTQRDQVVEIRREAIRALLGGNLPKFRAISRGFMKRYGQPLMISQRAIEQAQRLQTEPRPRRILQNLPADVRPQFASETGRRTPTPQQAAAAASVGQGSRQQLPGAPERSRAFEPFTGFSGL